MIFSIIHGQVTQNIMFTLQVIVVLAPNVLFNIALFLRKIFATFGFFVAVKDVREREREESLQGILPS